MASKNITFDPDTGVPYAVNLTIYGGSNFDTTFNVTNNSNSAFDFTDYSGSAAISKSVAVGATLGITTSFTVGITSALVVSCKYLWDPLQPETWSREDICMMF